MWWVPVLIIGLNGSEPVSLEHNSYYFTEEQCMQRALVLAKAHVAKLETAGYTVDKAQYYCKPAAQVS
jgi:hypothetical protein